MILLSLLLAFQNPPAAPPTASTAQSDTAHIVVVATTDIHGRILGWDYVRDAAAPGGLSRVATALETLRARYPNNLVLVDAGRTGLLGSDFQEMLRCIRCGACMNHCPVYQKIGGHAYGWVYPGPMGSVLTPSYIGLENALDLPHAATLCGQCSVVCPVKIPLPDLQRKLREKQWERHLRPWYDRAAVSLWAFAATTPALYALGSRIAVRVLKWMGGADGRIRSLPVGAGWTATRDLPAPSGRTFRDLYRERRERRTET